VARIQKKTKKKKNDRAAKYMYAGDGPWITQRKLWGGTQLPEEAFWNGQKKNTQKNANKGRKKKPKGGIEKISGRIRKKKVQNQG